MLRLPRMIGHNPSADFLCDYMRSGNGKDFRYLAQRLPFMAKSLVSSEVWSLVIVSSWLSKLFNVSEVQNIEELVEIMTLAIQLYIQTLRNFFPAIASRPKVHYLLHFPEYVKRFGLLRLLTSELGGKSNGPHRLRLFHSNRQNPSRDVGYAFRLRETLSFLSHDGSLPNGGSGADVSTLSDDPWLMRVIGVRSAQVTDKQHRYIATASGRIAKVDRTDKGQGKSLVTYFEETDRWNPMACQILMPTDQTHNEVIDSDVDVLVYVFGNTVRNTFFFDDNAIDLQACSRKIRNLITELYEELIDSME